MVLEEYKDIVGASAGVVTIAQIFSGVFVCKDIYLEGNTKKVPPLTFVAGFVISLLFLQNGIIIQDATMGVVNFVAVSLNVSYLLFYYLWCDKDTIGEFYNTFFKGLLVLFVLIGYAQIEDPEKIEFRFGMIITVLMMGFIAAPLFDLKEIIRTKSTEKLPFPMIFSGTIVTLNWLLYGIIIENEFIIFQNVIAAALSLAQLSLFVIYPSNKKSSKKVQ